MLGGGFVLCCVCQLKRLEEELQAGGFIKSARDTHYTLEQSKPALPAIIPQLFKAECIIMPVMNKRITEIYIFHWPGGF